ncbi:MAG: HlyD family efflux transporter periplasmic adaptor subunit [Paraglaciecola sp.]|uniref:HlyD family secretion protein n=1 Tax=Paraglaciecola sp. TaxID=1920173 RepID=UPI003297EE5B
MKVKMTIFILLGLFTAQALGSEQPLILTGIITSSDNQVVTAPKTNRWQVQIQWMAEEGSIVNKGELVAVFDSGGIESQLEENQEKLETQSLELLQLEMEQEQAVLEAEGKVKLSSIMVEKTRIEASVADGEVSAYEKGKSVIEYEKALTEKIKAQQSYALALEEQQVEVRKKKIEIIKLKENIAYQISQLDKLSVKALVTGPVTHAMHRWSSKKIETGMNIQASWDVLTVQAAATYQVSAWLHEVDAARVDLKNSDYRLTLDAYPEQSYNGEVLAVSSQAEQKAQWSDSAYYRVEIGFDDDLKRRLFPGMSVRVKMTPKAIAQHSDAQREQPL